MLMTKSGTAIRMDISTIRQTGRAAQGVKLIELQKRNDTLVSGCIVPKDDEENGDLLDSDGHRQSSVLNGENGDASLNGENGEINNENQE